MLKDLFGNISRESLVRINLYADEIQGKPCPTTGDPWHYIGLIIEDVSRPLLQDIISERFRGNFDERSPYFRKNNVPIHWIDIRSANEANICKRWFKFILDPSKSGKSFYSYILGLNYARLNKEAFDYEDQFGSIYNRFFRTAIIYAIKTCFPNKRIYIENIYHEEGQQETHKFFPWHCIYKIESSDDLINVICKKIIFLPKDHTKHKLSNMIQLCDCILGASSSIIHGFKESKRSVYRRELADIYLPLVQRMIKNPNNKRSSYRYANRMMIRFFPATKIIDKGRMQDLNQFYTERELYYARQISRQPSIL